MTFAEQINAALFADPALPETPPVAVTGTGELPSCFATSDFAVATVSAAAGELAALRGDDAASVNRRHALMWFDMTLRPQGWTLPNLWDPIAGDYATADGWIRLHTNAPHHCAAALSVLGCDLDRAAVAKIVANWTAEDLETAVVAAKGCAAAMRPAEDWAHHPQGKAVAAEPLMDWTVTATDAAPVALHGVKILDLTRVLAGPVATRLLAGFGADVLRIDPPSWDEPGVVPEVTLGKRCAGLDLTQPDDRATFEALVRGADVMVHGYRRDALAGMGYNRDALRRLNPHLIDVSLNAYGNTGPWANRRGFDSLVQMSSGIAHTGMITAGANTPRPLPVQALDHGTGYLIAACVLRALRLRGATGTCTSARLSLARVAHLLASGGTRPYAGEALEETAQDLSPTIETTVWGTAQRIHFPIVTGVTQAHWPHPAGPLRRHRATWAP
ncbi:CoA transferase [Pseudooctadecabacter jejudonensis]|uniref:Formyl-coenzyme A transferase n=1 Tax=Pseudooctadecabacter jejudonensis TaxID=1391910 RepID=A0A1Y5RIS5_9RHOB|nr:CoA transferase [Pseudooctadecabacter jejudonensis]SLN18308.1 Formyl-coenzyme A transferase [Pseudooctadecabacter jejudonensis]